MGIDTFRIIALCYEQENKIITCSIDFTNLQDLEEIKYLYEYVGLKVNGIKKFNDIFATSHGHLKIYGYMTKEFQRAFNKLFDILFEQNETVKFAEVHFWCSDFKIPFVLKKHKDDTMKYFVGSKSNILYSELDLTKNIDDEAMIFFDENKYKIILEKYPKLFWQEMDDETYEFIIAPEFIY